MHDIASNTPKDQIIKFWKCTYIVSESAVKTSANYSVKITLMLSFSDVVLKDNGGRNHILQSKYFSECYIGNQLNRNSDILTTREDSWVE